jgi:hypothetical protein
MMLKGGSDSLLKAKRVGCKTGGAAAGGDLSDVWLCEGSQPILIRGVGCCNSSSNVIFSPVMLHEPKRRMQHEETESSATAGNVSCDCESRIMTTPPAVGAVTSMWRRQATGLRVS